MIWKEMKDFCDSLSEEQLKENVSLWREDEAINNIVAEELDEDMYVADGDEGCYPLSEATEPIEELRKVHSKGKPILYEIF